MLDNRTQTILIALNRQPHPVMAGTVISPHTCDVHLTSSILRNAKAAGLADYELVKRKRFWRITEAGRSAIGAAEPAIRR